MMKGIMALSALLIGCSIPPVVVSDSAGGGGSAPMIKAACQVDDDCVSTTAPCSTPTCAGGVCMATAMAEGPSPRISQEPRDCHRLVCDGKGGTVNIVDDTDLPSDGNPCTEDTCSNGEPMYAPVGRDVNVTGCTAGQACDGAGHCLSATFIPCDKPAECASGSCYTISLLGGGVCRRAVGDACTAGEECNSNLCSPSGRCVACDIETCAGGVCFNGACFGACAQATDCQAGYACTKSGFCVNDCSKNPCQSGQLCVNSICVPGW